ncbi:SpoIIE family protein phosphatase [Crocinitomix catalasitica]|nr:SpoIIE family protein phosphatase [Crocinitomix catalasitica]
MKILSFILLLILGFTTYSQIERTYRKPLWSEKLTVENQKKAKNPIVLDVRAKYNFINLGLNEGLASKLVRKIWIDSRNFIWIATNGGGISIYDGKKFRQLNTTHGLSNDIVWDFEEDIDGRIWIATDVGISIFDGVNWEYRTMKKGNFGSEIVLCLMKDRDNRIWMGTAAGGFSIYFDKQAEHHIEILGDSATQIHDMVEDVRSGKVWLGTHGKGILEYTDGEIEQHLFGEMYSRENVVYSVEVTYEGDTPIAWAGTLNGLFRKAGNGDWRLIPPEERYAKGGILDLMRDSKDNLWIASGGGLSKWSSTDTIIFTTREGLKNPVVQTLCEDAWGNTWIGFRKACISKFLGPKFIHYDLESGLPAMVRCTYRDKEDNIWMGLESDGVVKYDGRNFLHYGLEQGFVGDEAVLSITEDDDSKMWFGMYNGLLSSFDGVSFTGYEKKTEIGHDHSINDMVFNDGRLWLGTGKGAIYIEGDSIHYVMHIGSNDIVDHYYIMGVDEDRDGYLWLGSFGGGAARIKGDKTQIIKAEHGLISQAVECVAQDHHGNYWFNLYGFGLMILKAGAFEQPDSTWQWMKIGLKEGLASNSNDATLVASDGDVWVSTARGICKIVLNGKDVFEYNYRIKTYQANEGFVGIECAGMPLEDKDGLMWFLSDNSISVFNPRLDVHTKLPPSPLITDMKIKLKDVDWENLEEATYDALDNWNNLPINLSLPFESNHIQFEFIGISYADPEGVEFGWKLDGFDKDWSPWTKQTNATYANLSWGEYQFNLRCRDSFGNVSESIGINFKIRKAYYHTWVFRSTMTLGLLLLIYLIFRGRTAALKNRQKVLEKTVEERTLKIKKQKEKIEHHQTEILDSISYAKRIQEAILPPDETVKQMLEESFVLYRPKDIVAGDFYWIEQVGDEIFIAAADCTGHGVPGAMVSVVCSNALNNTVLQEGVMDPGRILDRVTELVVEQFKKGNERVKDGMDICLCRWNKKKGDLIFAGAHNPLWKVKKESQEIEEYKASKQPVGEFEAMIPFKSEQVHIEKGDRIYLFSDGFADQFGGPKGKKLKTANFKKLICSIQQLSLKDQKEKLNAAFEEWKGELEQLDDVCVIGVEI